MNNLQKTAETRSNMLSRDQEIALKRLQMAVKRATDCSLFDEMAAYGHPDRINAFCDDVGKFASANADSEVVNSATVKRIPNASLIHVSVQDGILTMPNGQTIDLTSIQAAINFGYQETGDPELREACDQISEITGLWQGPNGEFKSADAASDSDTGTPHQFAIGEWMHLFGVGSTETRCRIVIDLAQPKLIAAQEWTGLKFEHIRSARLEDLADSVLNANEAQTDPTEWGLDLTDEVPEWASLKNQIDTELVIG